MDFGAWYWNTSHAINKYQSSTYGDEVAVDNSFSVKSGSVILGDNLGINFSVEDLDNRSNVNTYDEVISFTYTNTNYHLQKGSFVYEITARPISITINNRQCEYGDDVIDDNSLYKITNGTIVNGDNLCVDLTVNLTGIKPNTYSITGDWNNSNYEITFTNGTLTITKRNITISTYQKSEYGTNVVIDNNVYTIESGSLANIDSDLKLVLTTSARKSSDVGTYPIILQSNNSNYNITLVNAEYEIVARKIKVEIDNQSSIYGDVTNSLTSKTYYNGSSISASDLRYFNIQLQSLATNKSNVGDYTITGINNETTRNDVTFIDGTYTITKRKLTIEADNKSSQYGDDLQELTYKIVNGTLPDNGVEQILNVELSTTANPRGGVKTYPITGTYNN